MKFDPSAFNIDRGTSTHMINGGPMATVRTIGEQNVEVLTKPFETVITRFNDLADVHEAYADDSDKAKAFKEKDDLDIIPERKLHKILVRLRFRSIATADTEKDDCDPCIFFARLELTFTDASSVKHQVKLVLRFSSGASEAVVHG